MSSAPLVSRHGIAGIAQRLEQRMQPFCATVTTCYAYMPHALRRDLLQHIADGADRIEGIFGIAVTQRTGSRSSHEYSRPPWCRLRPGCEDLGELTRSATDAVLPAMSSAISGMT
jgi:hypothetical protein